MPSFDVVVKTDLQEVENAVNQAQKEIGQRFDLKGGKNAVDWDKKGEVTVTGAHEMALKAVTEILFGKFTRRGVSIRNLDPGKVEEASGGTYRQRIALRQGIPVEKARDLVKLVKDTRLKVQASIQQEQIRVTGGKRDDLQQVIAALKQADCGLDLAFDNYRD